MGTQAGKLRFPRRGSQTGFPNGSLGTRPTRVPKRSFANRVPKREFGNQDPTRRSTGRSMNADTLPDLFRQQADRLGPRVALRFKQDGPLPRSLLERIPPIRSSPAPLRWCGTASLRATASASCRRIALEWLVADHGHPGRRRRQRPAARPVDARQIHFQLADAGRQVALRIDPRPARKTPADPGGVAGQLARRQPFSIPSPPWPGFLQRRPRFGSQDPRESAPAAKQSQRRTTWPRSCTPPARPAIPRA